MNVHIETLVEVFGESQEAGATANNGHRGLDGFLHDIAQLARRREFSLARNDGRFDGEKLATDLGPGETGNLPDLIVVFGLAVAETTHAEVVLHAFWRDQHAALARLEQQRLHDLAADLRNFALEVT